VPLVIPFTLVILIGLFLMESRGTAAIGRLFGPIMLVWFATLSVIGIFAICARPRILDALNPYYGS
jgi:KUP system potassium uptake protein